MSRGIARSKAERVMMKVVQDSDAMIDIAQLVRRTAIEWNALTELKEVASKVEEVAPKVAASLLQARASS